jgi:hypothetical protein
MMAGLAPDSVWTFHTIEKFSCVENRKSLALPGIQITTQQTATTMTAILAVFCFENKQFE